MSFLRRARAAEDGGGHADVPGRVVRAVVSSVRDRWRSSTEDPASPARLVKVATHARWSQGPPGEDFLRMLHEELFPRPLAKVALIGGPSVRTLSTVLRRVYPELTLVVPDPAAGESAVHVTLCGANPYNLVVDVSDPEVASQSELFNRTFFHLGRGGAYIARRITPALRQPKVPASEPSRATEGLDLAAMLELAARTPYSDGAPEPLRDLASLGGCLGEIRRVGESMMVRNAKRVRPKLRDFEVNPVLTQRPEIGRVVETRPGVSMASRCDYEENVPLLYFHPEHTFDDPQRLAVLKAPALHLRVFREPTCGRGQIVESSGLLLSDTFRHHPARRLVNVYVNDTARYFGEVRTPLGHPLPLEGAYFHFDSEWPGHFGHTMTEQISRLWAYQKARELEPTLKLLTTMPKSRPEQLPQDWELALLEPFGIAAEDVVVFDQAVRPERLYAATPMFASPYYVHEQITDTWDLIAGSLSQSADPDVGRARRLFCSRRASLKRACRNAPEVEQVFVDHGFTVVYPEDYSMAEQVAMFQAAEVIGGFAGSGLFTMAFCRTPKTVIMIGPESYTARNEYLFAAVRGHRLRAVWSRPDIDHDDGRWNAAAFASSFVVDFEREGRYLHNVLQLLPG